MRAVLDVNILISAALSRRGTPAELVRRALAGEFELIVSPALLAELGRALAYSKVRSRVPPAEAQRFVDVVRRNAVTSPDPAYPVHRSVDPGDDYLLALAERASAILVSGDQHLLDLGGELPVRSARAFLAALERQAERERN